MYSPRFASFYILILSSSLLAALIAGCAGAGAHRRAVNSTAPGLQEDSPNHGRAGTNPNAPFVLIDRTKRPTALPTSMSATDAQPCTGKDLALTEVAAEMKADTHLVKFAFVNQGSVTCRIGGYPSIDLLDQQGQPVASLAVEQTGRSTLAAQTTAAQTTAPAADPQTSEGTPQIVLQPRGEAYFGVEWTSGDNCPDVAKAVMTAPGTSQAFTVSRPLKVCSGQVHVTALQATQNAS
jgi:hypothetical protein